MLSFIVLLTLALPPTATDPLEAARDAQDRPQLERLVAEAKKIVDRQPNLVATQYRFALAQSYLAEVALELKDKPAARAAAETGIEAARKTVALDDYRAAVAILRNVKRS